MIRNSSTTRRQQIWIKAFKNKVFENSKVCDSDLSVRVESMTLCYANITEYENPEMKKTCLYYLVHPPVSTRLLPTVQSLVFQQALFLVSQPLNVPTCSLKQAILKFLIIFQQKEMANREFEGSSWEDISV